ncbi:TPM domain-containing protein [Streptomyces sp. NPDC015131]|uniref:TPM domain-containing protein n=1 Tax=Streptomyces sp. NPDC015131 TaxID=3364941 RepID=UPI003700AE34
MTRRATRACLAVLLGLLVTAWWLVLPGPPGGARAEDPADLAGRGTATDKVAALEGREREVSRALDALDDDGRVRLSVVYVRDFSGRSPQEWADATAARNGLGAGDVLLAVATREGRYAHSAGPATGLTPDRLGEVARVAIEPALRRNDWAGAAIGAARGYAAALDGRPVPRPTPVPGPADPGGRTGSAVDLLVPAALLVVAGAVAARAYAVRRRRTATRTTPHGGRGPWSPPAAEPAPPAPDAPDGHDEAVERLLVDADEAVRAGREEVALAVAPGASPACAEAARPYGVAVADAAGELAEAFRLRQWLDDARPADDAVRRRTREEIAARCGEAGRRLDAEAERFDRVCAPARTAPEALTAAESALREVSGRADLADAALAAMRARYGEAAAARVAAGVADARERLGAAAGHLARAREAAAGDDAVTAATRVRAAEGAVARAAPLVDAVDRHAGELAEAAGVLPAALAGTEADLAEAAADPVDAAADPSGAADLRGRAVRAETVLAEVRRTVAAGRYDPVAALRRVDEADALLDEALDGVRERGRGAGRVRALLDRATLLARSATGAAADLVAAHREAVGAPARTRLAEAHRLLERAVAAGDTPWHGADDARAALAGARRADVLARQALGLAEQDVARAAGRGGGGGPG